MTGRGSLAARLLAGAAVVVLVALVLAGAAIGTVLFRFVRLQVDERLDGQIRTVADALRPGDDGPRLERAVDGPPFERPRTGWSWQVSDSRGAVLRSRSLEGRADLPSPPAEVPLLPPPPPPSPPGDPADGEAIRPLHRPHPPLPLGWDGESAHGGLHLRAARVFVAGVPLTIIAAAPAGALWGPVGDALLPVALALAVIGLVLVGAVLLQVRLGLRPLAALQAQLAAVRRGERDAVPAAQPTEIVPLVVELNALLAENAANLAGARRHLSNLAHGLKTPLATLEVTLQGRDDPAARRQRLLLARMERQIRHHLTRARAAALGGAVRVRTPLAPVVGDLADAFRKIHADRALHIMLGVDPGLALAADRQDLDEMVGNLMDNACRWARTALRVAAQADGRQVSITVEDDGPGLPEDALPEALVPGRRLDESGPGYGFGLPITRDLAALYGGTLALDRSPLGGLRANLRLPAAQT